MTLKYLLLDSDVIIHLHELALWDPFIMNGTVRVCVASTVINESIYFDTPKKKKVRIRLGNYVKSNQILEWTASPYEINQTFSGLPRGFAPQIEAGERESIAILKREIISNVSFCTGDGGAMVTLGMLNMSEYGISLESAMNHFGMKRAFKWNFSDAHFKRYVDEGNYRRITNLNLN